MTITISRQDHPRKTFNGRYVASIAGAAIAAAALVIGATWQGSVSGTAPVTVAAPARVANRAPTPAHYFYIVGSVAEGAAVLRAYEEVAEASWQAALGVAGFDDRLRPTINVLVAGSPAAAEFLHTSVEALLQAGMDFRVIHQAAVERDQRQPIDQTVRWIVQDIEAVRPE